MRIAFLFVIGGLLGATFDGFHTHSGTLSYPDPWLFRMAWWVPLLFGAAAVVLGKGHALMDERWGRVPDVRFGMVMVGLCLFGLMYFASGFLNTGADVKTFYLGVFALTIFYLFEGSVEGFFLALFTAVIGCAAEATLIGFGLFSYREPDFFGVPMWLPFLYVAASVTVGNFARLILERKRAIRLP